MKFTPQAISDIVLIEPVVYSDHRGYFMEVYHQQRFFEHGLAETFVQDNVSRSVRGTLRGLHYQRQPHAQGKLVRVFYGEVFDVAVDIRQGSATFAKWVGITLSAQNSRSLYIPPGFAHGYYVLSDHAEFTYKCTAYYAPESEGGILWNDPEIGINWPLIEDEVILSDRDRANLPLRDAERFR